MVRVALQKHFSVHGGMGSALLQKPEVAADVRARIAASLRQRMRPSRPLACCTTQIIGSLRRNLPVPVSCKIRLLDSPAETVSAGPIGQLV